MFRLTVAATLRAGALFIALAASSAAMAQTTTPANFALARDVVVASGATRAFQGVIPSILQQSLGVFVQQNPDLTKDLTETVKAMSPDFEKRVTEIVDIVAGVYATRFTEAELKDILTFYRSASGKKLVAQLPGVLEESFVKTQEWSAKISEQIVVRLRADMKKKGHTI
ncbi:MAG TPA: DUF2059 domain-containing protein [Xanthobacteraceae bacterium]|jgi:hypothetical protein